MKITDRILETIKELANEKGVNKDEISLIQVTARLATKLNQAENNEVLDRVSKREILYELLTEQEEIISSPIRFNGVSIEKLKQIFEKNGVKYEIPF